jgi:hypothetical protein
LEPEVEVDLDVRIPQAQQSDVVAEEAEEEVLYQL